MALKQLKKKIDGEVTKRMSVIEPKLTEMIKILKQIEKNTRKK